MRMELKTLLGVAAVAFATQAAAQVVYEKPVVVVNPADQIYQAPVTSVQAVSGAPEQRCWTERKQIGPIELPGAIVTGVGDLLSGQHSEMPLVRHCETTPGTTAYWDVTYNFRGVEHRVQLSAPPGPTVAVNGYGDPRG
jgi:uncharacterized protein YcfJ